MKKNHFLFVLPLILIFMTGSVTAQIAINTSMTPAQLVQNILGGGVNVSNVTMTGTTTAYGSFSNGNTTNIGLNSGVILTNGDINNVPGPNTLSGVSFDNGLPGDADLDMLAGVPTYDANILEFDFVPLGDTIRFRYVFGSEEYNDFVNMGYNDVFGFFISGPGIIGSYSNNSKNIALLPGTATPVSIDNVNNGFMDNDPFTFAPLCATGPCTNCAYFIDNCNGATIEYDGFTTVLTAWCIVTPNQTYHIKLAIADASDGILDSGVFLDGNSFNSNCPSAVTLSAGIQSSTCNNSNDGAITLTVGNVITPVSFLWSNGSTSQNLDNINAGTYSVVVIDSTGCPVNSTFVVTATNVVNLTMSSQNAHCNQSDGYAVVTATGGSGNFTYLWNNGQSMDSIYNLPVGVYIVTVSDGICNEVDSVTINNLSAPVASVSNIITATCGSSAGSINVNVTGGVSPYSYTWNSTPPQYTKDLLNVVPGNYCLSVTDSLNCMTIKCATIAPVPFQSPDICIVSVDTATNNNLVVWEKTGGTNGINQYYIYRETAVAGVYALIGTQNASVLSSFIDTGSNPAIQSYRYKLAIYDNCGLLSQQSNFHETIHLTANLGINNSINLNWNPYQGFAFNTYNIYRGNNINNLTLLYTISSNNNSYTDLNPPGGNVYYLVEVVRSIACNPSKDIILTMSNIFKIAVTGISESSINKGIRIYPNPGTGIFTISMDGVNIKDMNCTVSTAIGQSVYKGIMTGNTAMIDLSGVAKGVYFLNLKNDNINRVAKIIVE